MGRPEQYLVEFNGGTLCLQMAAGPSLATASSLLDALRGRLWSSAAAASAAAQATAGWRLLYGGRFMAADSALPAAPSVLRVFTGGLLGGKGGFGAMLRSMAKQAGKKPTRDFGACRDLQGRRLRHVNDEIRLRKWREDREEKARRSGGKVVDEDEVPEPVDERTPSGISGWHLGVPSWAEGIKMGKEKTSFMKPRRKTGICNDWANARAGGRSAPDGAPPWWGCPRGRNCDFAHGEAELRGVGLREHKKRTREEASEERRLGQEGYVAAASAGDFMEGMSGAVQQGLLAARSAKKQRAVAAAAAAADTDPQDGDFGKLAGGKGAEESEELREAPELGAEEDLGEKLEAAASSGCSWMETLAGQLALGQNGRAEGVSDFGSARVTGAAINSGRHYYEAWLLTAGGGIVQLGWADREFKVGEEPGDGVGDDPHSWAYDGVRQRCWSGVDREYGSGAAWARGDVVGCLLEADAGTVSFTLNGESLGVAFSGLLRKAGEAAAAAAAAGGGSSSGKRKSGKGAAAAAGKEPLPTDVKTLAAVPPGFYPAISVTQGEAVVLRVSRDSLAYPPPEGYTALGDSMPALAAAAAAAEEPQAGGGAASTAAAPAAAAAATAATTSNGGSSGNGNGDGKASNGKASAAAAGAGTGKDETPASKAAAASAAETADAEAAEAAAKAAVPLDLMRFETPTELLEYCGPDRVKRELAARGVKVGGTPYERAARLHSLRGLEPSAYPEKVLAKKK